MRKLVSLVASAILVLASVSIASASDGHNNIRLAVCDEGGYAAGVKFFANDRFELRPDGTGGAVMCAGQKSGYPYPMAIDSNFATRDGADWREGIWNLDNETESIKVKIYKPGMWTLCLYEKPGFGDLLFHASSRSDWDIDIPATFFGKPVDDAISSAFLVVSDSIFECPENF